MNLKLFVSLLKYLFCTEKQRLFFFYLWDKKWVSTKAIFKCASTVWLCARVHLPVPGILSLTMRLAAGITTCLALTLSLFSSQTEDGSFPHHFIFHRTSLCEICKSLCVAVSGIQDRLCRHRQASHPATGLICLQAKPRLYKFGFSLLLS